MIGTVRSNRAALLVSTVVLTVFFSLIYFYLGTSNPGIHKVVGNQSDAEADAPVAIATAVPEKKPAAAEDADVPSFTTVPQVAEPEPTEESEPTTESEPTSANLDRFTPEQWIQPSVKPADPKYYDYGAWKYELPDKENPIWTENLGKKLCIVDLESRGFEKPGELWHPDGMSWSRAADVHPQSGGTLNHWAYAKIHGYQYYWVRINKYKDRRDSWKKPSVLAEILKKHDVCVFIDSDAIFNHLDLPIEWLMNYWSINPKNNSMALPFDPDVSHNKDKYGKIFQNTGFMILQNNNKTYEIFKEWDDCPNEGGRHPECTEFRERKGWQPTDQGGFGTFIRYDFPEDIIELPCTEANGFPNGGQGCEGKFIKHVWLGKEDRFKVVVGNVFPGVLLETFHKQFLAEKDDFYTTEDELKGLKSNDEEK